MCLGKNMKPMQQSKLKDPTINLLIPSNVIECSMTRLGLKQVNKIKHWLLMLQREIPTAGIRNQVVMFINGAHFISFLLKWEPLSNQLLEIAP